GHRHAEHVECHCDKGIIAEQPYEFDRAGIAQKRVDLPIGGVADPPVTVEFFREGVDRPLVRGCLLRGTAPPQVPDGLDLHALLFGNGRVGGPLVLRFPLPRGHQNRKFRKPRRQRRAESAMRAEFLGEFAECGSMKVAIKRPAHLELAARPGTDRIDERALRGRKLLLGDGWQARGRDLVSRHGRFRLARETRCGTRYLVSSTRAVVTGPSPMISRVASSSLAPSQCTRLPKWVT